MSSTVHSLAQAGFGVGMNEHYDKSRPSFPADALSALQAALPGASSELNILELGSGTGIFTRALLTHPSLGPSVKTLKAIEPSDGMRATFSDKVKDPRVSTHYGTFDTTGEEDGWADLVVIAQAWHWCPDYGKAMAEIKRVLKPNGIAAFIWNLEDRDASWVAKLRDFYELHEQGTPQFRLDLWRATFSTPEYEANFLPPEEQTFTQKIPTTAQGVIDRVFSKSYIAVLDDEVKKEVREQVTSIANVEEDKVWIDKESGVFEYPYKTLLITMKQK